MKNQNTCSKQLFKTTDKSSGTWDLKACWGHSGFSWLAYRNCNIKLIKSSFSHQCSSVDKWNAHEWQVFGLWTLSFSPPCKELGRGWRVSEEDLQQCACSLFQMQNLDSVLTELMENERDAWCQIANFIFLICEHLWNFPGLGPASAWEESCWICQ